MSPLTRIVTSAGDPFDWPAAPSALEASQARLVIGDLAAQLSVLEDRVAQRGHRVGDRDAALPCGALACALTR